MEWQVKLEQALDSFQVLLYENWSDEWNTEMMLVVFVLGAMDDIVYEFSASLTFKLEL
jgi:hypothetical protein